MEDQLDISPKKLRDHLIKILVICNLFVFLLPYVIMSVSIDFSTSRATFSIVYWTGIAFVDAALVFLILGFIRPIGRFVEEWEKAGGDLDRESLESHWIGLTRLPLRITVAVIAVISVSFAIASLVLHLAGIIDLRQALMVSIGSVVFGMATGMGSYAGTKAVLNPALEKINERYPFPWGGIKLNLYIKLSALIIMVAVMPLLIFSLQVERWNNEEARRFYNDFIQQDLAERANFLANHWEPKDNPPAFTENSDHYFITTNPAVENPESGLKRWAWEAELPEYYTAPMGHGLFLARNTVNSEWKPYTSKLRRVAIIYFICISLLALISGYAFSRSVGHPMRTMTELTRQIATGQAFRYQHLISWSDDEAGDLSMAFNDLLSVVQKQFGTMESLLDRIREAVQVLGSSTAEMRAVVDRQAEGAQAQAGRVSELAGASTEIATAAAQITDKSLSVKEAAEGTLGSCIEGMKRIETAVENIGHANRRADEMVERMIQLEGQFNKIEEVIGSIAEVSDRTELISLNAALEAAGARKFGQRFGVVATEVKRLASAISSMTAEIHSQISLLKKSLTDTGRATRESAQVIEAGVSDVAQVRSDLDELSKTAEKTFTAAIEINISTKQQTQATERLADTLQEITDLAQAVAIGSEESRRAIEEINQLAMSFNDMLWSSG